MKRIVLVVLTALAAFGNAPAEASKKPAVVKKAGKKNPKKSGGKLFRNTTIAGKPFYHHERVLSAKGRKS